MNTEVIILIAINFLVTQKGIKDSLFMRKYSFNVRQIQGGEKIRLLTSGFLHLDWNHFIFNMLTLYFFAPVIIGFLGKFTFLMIYIFCLLLGNIISLKKYENQPNYTAVGASGAIMGVVYASILLSPDSKIYLFFLLGMPAYIFGFLYLLYSIYGMKNLNDGVGHTAHIGGAIGGFLSVALLRPHLLIENYWISFLLLLPIIYFGNLLFRKK